MRTGKIFFITGATGLVGGLLTLTALRAGHSVRLLARSQHNHLPEERIRRVLGCLGFASDGWHHQASKIEIYEGDITTPRFGLSDREWQRLSEGLSGIYHSAAYIGFRKDQRARSVLSNIDGTRHVLDLAESSQAHLFHISTAYVAGDTKGRILEKEIAIPPAWRNPYEETKFLAEQEVHSTCRRKRLPYTVFRPAILIGDSIYGRTIRFNSVYYFMKLFHRMSKQTKSSPAILKAKPEATLNLVPVDFAIKAIWDLSGHPGCAGKIFHITNPSPPRFQRLTAIAETIFDLSIACSAGSETDRTLLTETPVRKNEEGRETVLSLYAPYMSGEPEFDLKNSRSLLSDYESAFPPMDEAYFRKILTYAIEHDWKDPSAFPAHPSHGKTWAGFSEKYFKEFLGARVNQPLLRNVRNLSAVFSIEIAGEMNSRWVLEVREGTLLSVSRNGSAADCSYVTDGLTFERIVRGLYPPEEAFFEGRVDIRGNMEKGLRVAAALSAFCSTFPYEEKTIPE